jgi:hypothetical protein
MAPTRLPIRNYSASQIKAFNNCQRLWFLQSILRIRFPQTSAQKRGTDIHDILEHWLNTKGELKKTHPLEFWRYMEWLIPHLPDPKVEEHLAVEQEIWLDTPSGLPLLTHLDAPKGIPLKGFIDLGMWGRDIPVIGDLKTTTNMRYALTPAELNQDIQLNTYARWVFGVQPDLDTVEVGHWYLKVEGPGKKPPKKPKSVKVLPVFTEITRVGNAAVWERDCATMKQMEIVSHAEKWEDVDPNLNHCSAYGGCNFREKCGVSARDTLFQQPKKGQDMSFLDKIKGVEAKNKPAIEVVEVAEVVIIDEGKVADLAAAAPKATMKKGSFLANLKKKPVVAKAAEADAAEVPVEAAAAAIRPPDAAPPTPSTEEAEGIRNEAQEKLEAKEAKKAAAAEKKAAAAEKKANKPRASKHKREFTLYIGCIPTKGEHQNYIMVEDWIKPTLAELNATVLESTKKQD